MDEKGVEVTRLGAKDARLTSVNSRFFAVDEFSRCAVQSREAVPTRADDQVP